MIDLREAGMGLRFMQDLRAVQDAISFLTGRHNGRMVAEQAGCQDLAEHVRQQLGTLAEERPTRLRVLVLGEFKSGKSSLINCLVGKSVAATGVGELTAAVCRILPTDSQRETVVMRSADAGSPDLQFSLSEFLAASQEHGEKMRSGQPSPLDGYVSADLYVRTALPVELVDTPGLGATQQNEMVAMDALAQADVVVLAIDSDNIGGARDEVLMSRIQSSGQPLLVALTKIDLLEDDEKGEVLDFVVKAYKPAQDRLFLVSANRFERTGAEPGIERLRDYLVHAAPDRAALRDRALLSQIRDLSVEVRAGLELVEAAVGAALEDVRQNREVVEETARLVTRDISAEVASMIRQKLQTEAEGILVGRIHNRSARLTEEEFTSALEQSVRNMDAKPFWDRLKTNVESRFQQEWSEGIKRQLEILNTNLEQHRTDMHRETAAVSDRLTQEEAGRLERKRGAINMAVKSGTAAVALLVFGFPFLAVAAAAIPGAWAFYAHKMQSQQEPSIGEVEYAVRMAVSEWLGDYVRDVMAGFETKLLRENLTVARLASDNYGRQMPTFGGTEEEISCLMDDIRRHISAMSALTAGNRLLTAGL